MFSRSFMVPVLALLAAPLALASDGVVEINQAAALAGGVTASDTPGFPVTIDARGSYRLTGNLSVGSPTVSAIEIASSTTDVQIDLGGFTISGPFSCPTSPCDATSSTASGISGSASELRVRGGSIRGFAGYGILESGSARISDVSTFANGQSGISIASGEISDCESRGNGRVGLVMGGDGIVRNSKASRNREGGILAGLASVVSDNVASANLGIGIRAEGEVPPLILRSQSVIRSNTASNNSSDGIQVTGTGSLVIDNVASYNTGAGISMTASGSVQRNTVNNNGFGLYLIPELGGNAAAYRDNVMNFNGVNVYNGVGVNLGNNSCNGTVTCP